MKGSLKKWLTSYGFIETEEEEDDIFVHESELDFEPEVGTELEFDVEETPKGLQAKNVKKAE